MKPRLLDLFCGAGGAARGYQDAGFEVLGVDIKSQLRYVGDEFYQEDAIEIVESIAAGFRRWLPDDRPNLQLDNFDAIHASPPCQAYSGLTAERGKHPDLIGRLRDALVQIDLPHVIENVPGAPLRSPVQLCGSSLGLPLKRHRLFETNFPLMAPGCAHGMHDPRRFKIRQHGKERDTAFAYVFGGGQAGQTAEEWREAMGTPWMTVDEMSEAIPPAFTEHIGRALLARINAAQEVAA